VDGSHQTRPNEQVKTPGLLRYALIPVYMTPMIAKIVHTAKQPIRPTVVTTGIRLCRRPSPATGYSASQRSTVSADLFSATQGSTHKTSRRYYISGEGSSSSITSDVEANSLARHDRRHRGEIATRHMGCELGSRTVEFENRETVAAVERFEYRDSHESWPRSGAARKTGSGDGTSRIRAVFGEAGHKKSRWISVLYDKQLT
jgi:hypothetical protein